MKSPAFSPRAVGSWILPLLVLLPLAGCIRSRAEIVSEPSGAEVTWRGQPYGATPVTIPFIWYWYYDVSIEKPGYKRIDKVEHFGTPPWFLIPTDLIMEIIPFPFHDTRHRKYVLEPKQRAGDDEKPVVTEINPSLPQLKNPMRDVNP